MDILEYCTIYKNVHYHDLFHEGSLSAIVHTGNILVFNRTDDIYYYIDIMYHICITQIRRPLEVINYNYS